MISVSMEIMPVFYLMILSSSIKTMISIPSPKIIT